MWALPGWVGGSLDPSLPSVGRAFRDAGYDTVYAGKWHLGEVDLADYGWDTTLNVHETSNPPEGLPGDTSTRDRTIDWLRDRDRTDGPFFLTASFNLPHPGFYEDTGFANRYDPDTVPLPESWTDDLDDKPTHHRERAAETGDTMSEAAVREMRYQYRTMVSRVDDHVGRILDALERAGLRDDTAVVVTADHGDMQCAHRLTRKGVVAYDEILRVPLIVDLPWREASRDRIPDLCSIASVPSTLLDAAGLPTDAVGGESLLPAFDRSSPPANEAVFFEHKYAYWGHHPYRGVRTRDWKFVEHCLGDRDELYHVAADPHELTNLASDPDHGAVEADLRDRVGAWWDRTDGNLETWTRPPDG